MRSTSERESKVRGEKIKIGEREREGEREEEREGEKESNSIRLTRTGPTRN